MTVSIVELVEMEFVSVCAQTPFFVYVENGQFSKRIKMLWKKSSPSLTSTHTDRYTQKGRQSH